MEQRQLALELFLKEYVVSVDNIVEDENAVRGVGEKDTNV